MAASTRIREDKRKRRPADETRREILQVAEEAFATAGVEGTRLEDIAGRIGIQRAALFYYFNDKQDLYNCTLQQLWIDLQTEVNGSMKPAGTSQTNRLQEQIEQGLVAVARFMQQRPAFARLILRLGSEPPCGRQSDMAALTAPLFAMLEAILKEGEKQGVLKPVVRNPALLASTLAGATAFYTAAMPVYTDKVPQASDTQYHQEIVNILRSLLGMNT